MVELVRAGRTPAELAREFDVTAQTIANWVGAAGGQASRSRATAGALTGSE
ncbi:IS3 family transposase, partial [Acidovorax citrulli]|nr:IS3 family transposase [Paracidovorax citrulli]